MLKRLYVENYALIERLEITPGQRLNIITGETGAGKSILLGAMSLLLGGKGDSSQLRDSERNCVVEAEFAIEGYNLEPLLEQNDIDYDPLLTIRRVVSPQGKSRAYINDLPIQLAGLKDIVDRLIDIHSQHQSLMIAKESFRLDVVDSVGDNGALRAQYAELYEQLRSCRKELETMQASAAESRRDQEYISFQHDQLTQAKLRAGEQVEAEQEINLLSNAEQIAGVFSLTSQMLDDENDGVLIRLKTTIAALTKIKALYTPAAELSDRMQSAYVELKDIMAQADELLQSIEADPSRLERLTERLNTIYSLEQKHKVESVEELLSLQDHYASKLGALEGYEQAMEQLKSRIDKLETKAVAIAAKITQSRESSSRKVEKYVKDTLAQLAMVDAQLKIDIAPAERLLPSGGDKITFMFSANAGSALQALEKVASGGEISRVMLAIKSLVARSSRLPTIIFDEIDTGVSGRIADAMGEIIADMSSSMQVIDITHLPQVASKGNDHFVVYKERSMTNIRRVDGAERIQEIAKMISGSDISDAALAQARILLKA